MPDGWVVERDGEVIAELEDADPFISGTLYGWKDWTAAPNRQHTYRVAAIVDGVGASAGGPEFIVTPECSGIWLADADNDLSFSLAGDGYQMGYTQRTALFDPISGSSPVQVTSAMHGLSGTVAGQMRDYGGRTWEEQEADLYAMKAAPAAEYRLVLGDLNIPVAVRDLSTTFDPSSLPPRIAKAVSFAFFQTGELPFDAEL